MFAKDAVCVMCGKKHRLDNIYRCTACQGPLDIRYDAAAIPRQAFDPGPSARENGIWVHADLLPVRPEYTVSLGEGHTPLLRCERLGDALGLRALWVKDETRQPTGSFKDRPLCVAVSKARELQLDTVVTASSGNAAASMSAYAARAGIRAVVFVPAHTPAAKLQQIVALGARVVKIRGTVSECIHMTRSAASSFGWYNVTTTFENPYATEGDKTVAYEMAAGLNWGCPTWVVVPTGAGPLPVGIWKGFNEMRAIGLVPGVPRLVAAQAAGCAPIARAFSDGAESVQPWDSPNTVASGIQDPLVGYTQDGTYTLQVVRQSGGAVIASDDHAILRAVRLMGKTEGLYVEPTVGAAIAAVERLRAERRIEETSEVVIVATGHGLKQGFVDLAELAELPEIDPTIEGLKALKLGH